MDKWKKKLYNCEQQRQEFSKMVSVAPGPILLFYFPALVVLPFKVGWGLHSDNCLMHSGLLIYSFRRSDKVTKC